MENFLTKTSRVVVCLIILVTLGTPLRIVAGAGAQGTAKLERSPLSGGVLMARAIRAGRVTLPARGYSPTIPKSLTCSPAPCVLPNVDAAEGGTNPVNEDPIATNPNNIRQFISGGNDYNCSSLQGFFATLDGGTTFHRNCLGVLTGMTGAGDPGVGYDTDGHVYVSGIDCSNASCSTTAQIVLAKSTDGGVTFPVPHTAVKSTFSGGFTDKDWMEIDANPSSPFKNTIYISITDFSATGNSQITVSHSTNGGATFVTKKVGMAAFSPAVNQFSDLAIGRDGTVYVSYINCPGTGPTGNCGGTRTKILVSKSTDGGNTWSVPLTAATVTLAPDSCGAYYGCLPGTSERVSNIPVIAVDNSSTTSAGKVYVAFYNFTTFASIRVVSSIDGGLTWSSQIHVSPAAIHDQFFPWINLSSGGIVGVTFLDRRNDPANVNYQAFAALSKNGGTSYMNKRISTATSNPNNDGFSGNFMGDYTGNSWSGKNLYGSWMDTRSGVSQDEVGGFELL